MIRKFVALLFAAMALVGCVLQSRVPLYTDAAGELVLGSTGGRALISSWKDGKWVKDTDTATVTVAGQHYEATSESSVIDLTFVRLRDDWYVLQAVERGRPAVYMLAEISERTAEITTIACTDLKKDSSLAPRISYYGDDCFIRPGLHMEGLFLKVLEHPGEPSSRLAIAD